MSSTLLAFAMTLGLTGASAASDPNTTALQIARHAKQPQKILTEIIKQVKRMKPSADGLVTRKLLDDTLSLLGVEGAPPFVFQVGQRTNQKELVSALKKALPSDKQAHVPAEWAHEPSNPLFPTWSPMPILAGSGTSWLAHHTYPGGLIYHLYATAMTNLKWLETTEKTYNVNFQQSEKDMLFLAGIWHDAAKLWTLQWKPDGTLTANEGKIAGAGSHHVISAAEALVRGHSQTFVMAIAASHDAASEFMKDARKKVVGYLVATAILARKPLEAVGVSIQKNGDAVLAQQPSLWMMIQNLGDGDWPLTIQALQVIHPKLLSILTTPGLPVPYWKVNALLAKHGEVMAYQVFAREGDAGLRNWVQHNQ